MTTTHNRAASASDDNPVQRLLNQAKERGYQFALSSMAHAHDELTLKALEGEALSMALVAHRPEYNPDAHQVDRIKQSRIDAREIQQKTRTEERDIAAAEARKRLEDLSKAGDSTPRPEVSGMLRWTAAIALTLSLSPTVHDLFSGLNDPFISWMIALGFGSIISLLMVTAILPNESAKKERGA